MAGWPTFLPVPIARQYPQLWTRQVAIEINETAHVPDETFIREAKRAGLKFTLGTDSRNQNAGHFYYYYQMVQRGTCS